MGIEPPVVFPHERDAIASRGTDPFDIDADGRTSLRYVDDHCIFFDQGRCAIYDVRPIDCRLFPLDVTCLNDGQIVWIAYQSICPSPYDAEIFRTTVRSLIREVPADELRRYATTDTPRLNGIARLEMGIVE